MKILSIVFLTATLSGCGKTGPTLAGGKPVAHWLKALGDADPKVRKTAVVKLGNMGSADPAVFPALLSALKDQDAGVRCEIILAFLKFGPQAKEAGPALDVIGRQDPDAKVRAYAAKALAKITAP